MSRDVLVVEDDPTVARSLSQGLCEDGFAAVAVGTCGAARRHLASRRPALLILDLGLPDGDGLSLLRELRSAMDRLPVIVLTARDSVADRVAGLDLGADDYLVKPFALAELLARVRARLRVAPPEDGKSTLRVADLSIDRLHRVVRRAGREVELTAREFDVLTFLAQSEGRPVSRDTLTREVWKIHSRVTPMDNIIDVHISHLREKVDQGFAVKLLHTVRGVGFVLSGKAP